MKNSTGYNKFIKQAVFYAIVIILWQAIAYLKIWPDYLVPSPAKVVKTLVNGFLDKSFIIGIAISMKRLFIGYLISIIFGSALGIALYRFRKIGEVLEGTVLGLQTLPSICWFPLAIIWFGLSEWAIIFVVMAGSLFSITMAVTAGMRNIPPIYLNVGRNMGTRGAKLLWYVMVPAATPALLIGVRQSWSFAWRSLMAGELLFNSLGLGFLLNMGRELNDMNQVVAVMFIIAMISIMFDTLIFGKAEAAVRARWGAK